MDIKNLISIDEDILGGQPVFAGTRVPIETLFDHLESSIPLNDFLNDFPSVTRQQAVDLLEAANKLFNSKNIQELYASVA
ncbi:MAG: DUF433 domain-containing protein [Sphingobacteriales bacterium]|nr:MAG: DUF433 domain-containing protein [Sphingobacteriales bacterium]